MASLINDIIKTQYSIPLLHIFKKSISKYYSQSYLWQQALLDCDKYIIKFITPFFSQYKPYPCINISWLIEITKQDAVILVTYVIYNGNVNFIYIEDQRMSEQIKYTLKGINFNKFDFSYLFTQQKMIMLRTLVKKSYNKSSIQLYLNNLLISIQKQISQRFQFFLPFLTTSSQFLSQYIGLNQYLYQFSNRLHKKDLYQKLSDLKNKFISRKNNRKQLISYCILQKQKNKDGASFKALQVLKKIQPVMKIIFFNTLDYYQIFKNLKIYSIKSKLQRGSVQKKIFYEEIQNETVVSGIQIMNLKSKEQNILDKLKSFSGSNGSISFQTIQFYIEQSIFIQSINLDNKNEKLDKKYNRSIISSQFKSQQRKMKQIFSSKSKNDFFDCLYDEKPIFQKQLAKKIPISSNQTAINSFKNEITVLTYLRNQKCKYLGKYYLQTKKQKRYQNLYMTVYQLNLKEFLDKKLALTINTLLKLALRISKGVSFLNHKSVCHRDIKPANIMIDYCQQTQEFIPKLIDFGSCCPAYDKSKYFAVPQIRLLSTKGYYQPYQQISPQIQQLYNVYQYQQHSYFDSYSLGKVIQKIFNLKNRFKMQNTKQKIIKQNLDFMVENCFEQNPIDRLSPCQICDFLQFLIAIDSNGWSKNDDKTQRKVITQKL